MDHSLEPDHLTEAGQRLVRTVDGFSGDDWSAPSLLPGWTRAHVVAHLALNGEALGGVLRGRRRGRAGPDVRLAGGVATPTSRSWPAPTTPSCGSGCWPA